MSNCLDISPVPVSGGSGAELNLYALRTHAFSESEIGTAKMIARPAGVVLHNVRAYELTRRLAGQLEEALSSRG